MTPHHCPNGLALLLEPDPSLPLVAGELLLRWGTGDEQPGEQGAAHFLEHMVFRGTRAFPPGALDRAAEALGGELNAWTGYDFTAFHWILPADHLEQGLQFLAELVTAPLLEQGALERERPVVLEEIAEGEDSPEQVIDQAVRERLFPKHALGAPILGTAASLRAMDAELLRRFWSRGYRPDRAALALVGDFDPEAARAAISRAFSGWERGDPAPNKSQLPQVQTGLSNIKRKFHTPWVQLGWRVPPAGHPDTAALELLVSLLGGGAASLLGIALEQEAELAFSTWCSLEQQLGAGAVFLGFQPRSKDALARALEVISEVARDGVSAAELDGARLRMLAELDWDQESLDARAHELARIYHQGGARGSLRQQLAAVEAHTLREVAARWLRPDQITGVLLDTPWKSAAPPPVQASGSAERHQWVLGNGVRVELIPRPGRLLGISAALAGGSLLEGEGQGGLARAWARMVGTSTEDMDVSAFSEEQDRAAVVLEARAGIDQVSLEASAPSASAREALDLFGAALAIPTWDPEEWERTRAELLQDLQDLEDRPDEVAQQLAWAALWRGHPWHRSPHGSAATLRRLGPRSLAKWHAAQVRGGGCQIAIAGMVSPALIEANLLPWLERLPPGAPELTQRPAPKPDFRPQARQAGRSQVSLLLAAPGAPLGSREAAALQLAAVHLSRQSGPLVQALREAQGLAYSVWSDALAGIDGGLMALGMSTRPSTAEAAMAGLRVQWTRLVRAGLSPEDLEIARRLWRVQILTGRQSVLNLASSRASALLFDRPWEMAEIEARLASYTLDEVQAALSARAEQVVEVTVSPK